MATGRFLFSTDFLSELRVAGLTSFDFFVNETDRGIKTGLLTAGALGCARRSGETVAEVVGVAFGCGLTDPSLLRSSNVSPLDREEPELVDMDGGRMGGGGGGTMGGAFEDIGGGGGTTEVVVTLGDMGGGGGGATFEVEPDERGMF